jgi:hypothetical protein
MLLGLICMRGASGNMRTHTGLELVPVPQASFPYMSQAILLLC